MLQICFLSIIFLDSYEKNNERAIVHSCPLLTGVKYSFTVLLFTLKNFPRENSHQK